jgi:endonuclease YncB( thermonuclease family)
MNHTVHSDYSGERNERKSTCQLAREQGAAFERGAFASHHLPWLIAFCVFVFCACPVKAALLEGLVVGIADGDTITLLDVTKTQYKIRLAGIDAPEKKQSFGTRSKQSLAGMISRQHVTVEWTKYDRYRRIVGRVLLNGKDVNLAQVSAGMAWHYKAYQGEQTRADRTTYAEAELEARAARAGLWRDALPTPPWEFRHRATELAQ